MGSLPPEPETSKSSQSGNRLLAYLEGSSYPRGGIQPADENSFKAREYRV